MFQHNTNYMNAINMFRATAGANPQHNQHIQHISQCLTDAFAANNMPYDMSLFEIRHTLKSIDERLARIESILSSMEKQPTPTPMAADIFITPQSRNRLKSDITHLFH